MSQVRIPVDPNTYKSRSGAFTQHRRIDYYSVTVDRQVLHNDRKEARLLINENISDGVTFDLALGLDTFQHKAEMLENEACLHPLCAWAVGMPGDSIDEVFGGAEVVCWRGTLKKMAFSLFDTRTAWTVVAQKFGSVILISEQGKKYAKPNLETYCGYKFEQYMTTDKDGNYDTNAPVDNRSTFETMVRTDLVVKGKNPVKICCGAEVDAIRGDVPIEFRTSWTEKDLFFRVTPKLIQCEIVGVDTLVTGYKKGDIAEGKVEVYKVVEKQIQTMKSDLKCTDSISKCYEFLHDILSKMKQLLANNEACEASFDPTQGPKVVNMKIISRQQAKDAGNGVTDEFITRFGL